MINLELMSLYFAKTCLDEEYPSIFKYQSTGYRRSSSDQELNYSRLAEISNTCSDWSYKEIMWAIFHRDSEGEDDIDDKEQDFSPEKGNVAFASAHDGWAFRISKFAEHYAPRMGVKAEKLNNVLWGDWALDSKTKRVTKLKKGSKAKPLFVQVIASLYKVSLYDWIVL